MSGRIGWDQFGLIEPAKHAVTPVNDSPLQTPCRAVYIGGDGDLAVVMVGDESVTFVGLTAGTMLPISIRTVRSTSTATNILALY